MPVKVYVVDNGGQWTHREWRVLKYLGVDTKIIPNTTPLDGLDADGLVLSGGAPRIGTDSVRLGAIGDYLDRGCIPLLGICVSHQFMAMHFGGETGASDVPEYGKVIVHIDADSKMLSGLPKSFTAWESHNDEVRKAPGEFRVVAHSENCRVQAMEHGKKPFFGLQFHPEVEHTEHGEEIFRNFIGVCKK
jgi:GMP synthase (glutamine-hydrolysing)